MVDDEEAAKMISYQAHVQLCSDCDRHRPVIALLHKNDRVVHLKILMPALKDIKIEWASPR